MSSTKQMQKEWLDLIKTCMGSSGLSDSFFLATTQACKASYDVRSGALEGERALMALATPFFKAKSFSRVQYVEVEEEGRRKTRTDSQDLPDGQAPAICDVLRAERPMSELLRRIEELGARLPERIKEDLGIVDSAPAFEKVL